MVRRSVVPTVPATWTESVFVVVAAPQANGIVPKTISPAAPVRSVACDPAVTEAVTTRVPGS